MESLIKPVPAGKSLSFARVGFALLPVVYIAIALPGLKEYLNWSSMNFIAGVFILPLMLFSAGNRARSGRFGFLAIILLLIGIVVPVKTIIYLSLCAILLFFYESRAGKTGPLPFITLFLLSPVCQYFSQIFSFPVRLWLTAQAGGLMSEMGLDVTVAGNVITYDQQEYAVDPACMGLNMFIVSLLCGVLLLFLYQKRAALYLKGYWIIVALSLVVLLNIIANLLRILLLVYFKLMPGNSMHDLCGLLCFAVYILLPAAFLIKKMVAKQGRVRQEPAVLKQPGVYSGYLHFLLLPLLFFCTMQVYRQHKEQPAGTLPVIKGYRSSWYDQDVIKMENANALIYIKPLKGFAYTDHNPLICWTASGYHFQNVIEQHWSDIPLFTGILLKGNDRLYTAWWYDNGNTATIDQWRWRWDMFRGGNPYRILNVTTADPLTLKTEVAKLVVLRKYLSDTRKKTAD